MTRIWTPVGDGQYGLYNGLEVDADGAQISMTAIDVYGVEHPVEETLPPDFALCKLVDAAPVPLGMPDSAGWWAFDGVDTEDDNYAYQCPFELRLSSGELRLAVGVDGMEEPIERFVGKWYRLQMPWQAQPSEEGDE
jgi:hypothetical protein